MRSIEERRLEKKEAELNHFGLIYRAIDATFPIEIEMVYRGAKRNPAEIFITGFRSQGTDLNLYSHAYPQGKSRNFYKESGFVSTSRCRDAALKFPSSTDSKALIQQTWLYEIIPSEPGVDVTKEFPKLATKPHAFRFYDNYIKQEKEIAFPYKIKPQDIKGAWPVDLYDAGIIQLESLGVEPVFAGEYYRIQQTHSSAYIPNPNYQPPVIPNLNDVNYNPKGAYLWNAAKYAGFGLTGIGAALDAHSLYTEYRYSEQKQDFTNTYAEASRIAGGWAAATRSGLFSAQKALLYSAPLSPLGQTLAVVISGVAGSAIGYYCGGEALQWLYNLNRRDDLVKPLYSEKIDTGKLSCVITTMKDGARIGRCQVNKNKNPETKSNDNAEKQSETEARQKHYFSNVVANIPAPTNNNPHDLYLSALNQQTQSINKLFAAPNSSVDFLQNHLSALQKSNTSSTGMNKALTTSSFSTRDLSEHLQNLTSSQNTFTQAFTSTRVTDFSQFNQQSRPVYHFDTAQEASRYATFFSNYMYGDFSERPKPPSHNFAFFGGDNRGEGGRGWDRTCDSRYQDCSSSNPSDCRSSNSDRCTSSLFK